MIVVLKAEHGPEDLERIVARLQELGYQASPVFGEEKTIVLGIGGAEYRKTDFVDQLRAEAMVEDVLLITKPYKLVSREYRSEDATVEVGGVPVGGPEIALMAGPCTVETEEQLFEIAEAVASAGARFLRGGAYKPTTSPYSFQGHGIGALRSLRSAADRNGLRVVTEVMDVRKVETVAEYADVLQIGTRNMQNYDLLREAGRSRRPILLKRGMSARVEEWLLAAEHIATTGNDQILLCERGIRTFETATRNTLDLNAVALAKQLSCLPVLVDPSHGTGKRDLVGPLARAAIAAGADGLLIEVHPSPDHAIKDGSQTIALDAFPTLVEELRRVAQAVGRSLPAPLRAG